MKDQYYGSAKEAGYDKVKWECLLIDPCGIIVEWAEKYGETKSVECIGIWTNDKQYMLTWKDAKKQIIEKSNTNDIIYRKK